MVFLAPLPRHQTNSAALHVATVRQYEAIMGTFGSSTSRLGEEKSA